MFQKIWLLMTIIAISSCGSEKSSKDPPPPIVLPPETPRPPPQGCDDGYLISFDDIRPLITGKYSCVSCHGYMQNYDTWQDQRFVSDVIRRIGLGENDNRRMPPPFREAVNARDREIFQAFQDDGRVRSEACRDRESSQGAYSFSSLDYIERNVLSYQQRLNNDADRVNTMFATNCHQETTWFTAIAKGLNSISRSFNLIPPTTIDPKACIYAIDLAAYGLTPQNWNLIVDNDPFQFISNTVTGKLVRDLANADVPILHGDNMLNVIYDNPDVYYGLLGVEIDRDAQFAKLGIDPAQEFLDEEARVIGLQSTQIALNKNRMMVRYNLVNNVPPGSTGFLWISHDIDLADLGQAETNIFENPLPFDSQGVARYEHTAEEWLWTLPNGMMGSALYAIQIAERPTTKGYFLPSTIVGVRQDAAPVTTVINLGNRFRSDIQVGNDCLSCHAGGPIVIGDELREPILAEGNIGFEDLRIVRDSYGTANINSTLFTQDKNLYKSSMERIRVNNFDSDPVNDQTDIFRDDWTAARLAPFFYLLEGEFLERIRNTQIVKQIPQVLTGGAISLTTLIDVADDIALELEIYEDP